jgi:opacity protein-like surface antigen
MRVLRTGVVVAAALLSLAAAGSASATWQLYASGEFGYSIGVGKVSGLAGVVTTQELIGKDSDVSPMLGGAFGVQMPLDELTPWRLPGNVRLPEWPIRFEIEAAGLREYELRTPGQNPGTPNDLPFNTKASNWSLMWNVWTDIPLAGLHRPIASTARVVSRRPQHLPRVKRFLRPASWYVGVGLGVANVNVETSDSILFGAGDTYNFAWQVGTGLGYQLTDVVNLGVGYRFFRPGDGSVVLLDSARQNLGFFELASDIHEVRFSMRILLYDLPYPWR